MLTKLFVERLLNVISRTVSTFLKTSQKTASDARTIATPSPGQHQFTLALHYWASTMFTRKPS